MSGDGDSDFWLILFLLGFGYWFFFVRETGEQKRKRLEDEERRREERLELQRQQAEQEKQARLERERKKAEAKKEFDLLVSKGMPASVAKFHREFISDNPLPKGESWYGEDVSPLTFYGYRVGKTKGLSVFERQDIIRYVMRVRITDPLATSYQHKWGKPLSRQRRSSIIAHIDKLAAQRGTRKGYEVAVEHWRTDSAWTAKNVGKEARGLGEYGFR